MPRPPAKRNRTARQGPPGASRPPAHFSKPAQRDVVRAIQNNTNNSDDSDGLVVTDPRRRNTPREAAFMSGALGKGDVINAHKHTPKRRGPEASFQSSRQGSAASRQPALNHTPVAKQGELAQGNSAATDRVSTEERTGLASRGKGYSSTMSLVGRRGDMNSRAQGTPAFESSMLSNFRRRPRQPSILQMMQGDETGSSDLDDEEFLGGFSPNDESTPLNLTRGKSVLHKETSSPLHSASHTPSSANLRKRKLTLADVHAPQSSADTAQDSLRDSPISSCEAEQDRESDDDQLPPRRRSQPSISPEAFSQTMAPPMSSSRDSTPIDELRDPPSEVPKENGKVNGKTRPTKPKMPSIVSTDALRENFLPHRRERRPRRQRGGYSVSNDSADAFDNNGIRSDDDELGYLPTRKAAKRQRRGLAEITNTSHTRAVDGASKRKGKRSVTHGTGTNRPTTVLTQHTTATRAAAKASQKSQQGEPVTYSSHHRRASERDKENLLSDTSSSLSSPPASEAFTFDLDAPLTKNGQRLFSRELELQAQKFADIDKWSMDFEDVSGSLLQSSPFR